MEQLSRQALFTKRLLVIYKTPGSKTTTQINTPASLPYRLRAR